MLNDKIKAILEAKNLSPSRFADEIGVQRSSISHILSGRNKPSLDLIQKINRRFPDLGTEWFMEVGPPAHLHPQEVSPPVSTSPPVATSIRAIKLTDTPAPPIPVPQEMVTTTEKKIEKILIFYTDKTFSEYRPTD